LVATVPDKAKQTEIVADGPKAVRVEVRKRLTKAEADAFTANSAIKKELTHVTTSKEAAEAIASGGFKLTGRLGGKYFGDGVYLGTDSTTTKFYQKYIGESYDEPVTLKLRVNVQNPLRVNVGDWNAMQVQREVIGRQIAKQAGLAKEYQSSVSSMNATNREIVEKYNKTKHGTLDEHKKKNGWVEDVSATAVKRVLESAGYDSLEIVDKKFRQDVGGNQLVVFDPKRVTVIDAGAAAKTKSLHRESWLYDNQAGSSKPRAAKSMATKAKPTRQRVEQPDDMTEDDDAILDGIWDSIE
jgi:hypothetical protein